ncbi:unnamed protein product [Notodromas monacha]|uniref:Chitin-binding type-4 domain-containing protein n=1 Tax=Notodromas monacha TaxID=399045 RepID=A0A7R9C0I7_9CRUS|nr:unnamed protein product [Notodromas monacha]CAG0925203.1 unnamed protein product [Notodromas monacha]
MIAQTQGHGRLTEPPSRATMWRYGWDNPVDYDDAQSFCGGFQVQWNQNEGRCGICGDAFNESTPRTHEVNGIYANGIIVDSYTVGAIVNVQVEITVNHKGYFQFRMCSYAEDGEDVEVSQECLDR